MTFLLPFNGKKQSLWICLLMIIHVNGFVTLPNNMIRYNGMKTHAWISMDQMKLKAYIPPEQSEQNQNKKKPVAPYPKVGDIVRYTDLDGGKVGLDGEVLVGKITFIQGVKEKEEWLVEIVELDDVGDGYYAEFPSRERRNRKSLRKLEEIAPVPASFVRSEDAFKIPFVSSDGKKIPAVSFESYNLVGYEGPISAKINTEIVDSDGERYNELKSTLIKDAALFGLFGAIIAQFVKGTEDALIYAAGTLAGIGYLFFLSIKTDTLASTSSKFGSNLSNIRFILPVFVLLGVSIKNVSSGDTNVSVFNTVTPEQFASAMIGFLSYRVPLFLRQLQPLAGESALQMIPGSTGIALQQLAEQRNTEEVKSVFEKELTPVLLVSGPPGTGKSTLIKELMKRGNGKFVQPEYMDRIANGAKFEVMESRGAFLELKKNGRYGLTVDAIVNAIQEEEDKVVIVDSNVELAKKLTNVGGLRLIGVWIGLDSLDKFTSRFQMQLSDGTLKIPNDETEESVIRSKIRDAVKDIEYGVVSGIFEFTILNDDFEESMKQLEAAAEYCFK